MYVFYTYIYVFYGAKTFWETYILMWITEKMQGDKYIYLVKNISDIKGLKWKFEFCVVLRFLASKSPFKIHILKNATDQTPANPQQFYSLLEMC